jgi:antitoxin component YwqK of YwqJK toxin-antitoxin module
MANLCTASNILGLFLLAGCATDIPGQAPREPGRPRVDVQCVDDRPHGLFVWRSPDRVVQVRGEFASGKKEGTWEVWNSAGRQTARIQYSQGVRTGPVTMWYSDPCCVYRDIPFRKLEGTFLNGKYEGTKSSFYPEPILERLRSRVHFSNGEIVTAEQWDAEGKAMSPSDALATAQRDVESDEAYLRQLDGVVQESIPCKYDPQP